MVGDIREFTQHDVRYLMCPLCNNIISGYYLSISPNRNEPVKPTNLPLQIHFIILFLSNFSLIISQMRATANFVFFFHLACRGDIVINIHAREIPFTHTHTHV